MNIKKLNEELDKYINEEYSLVGINGNAFSIMGYVANAMKEQGFSKDDIETYRNEATSSDYNNLLRVSQEKIEECNEKANKNIEDKEHKEGKESNTNIGPQSGNFTVTFGPGTYYIGDICYCLNDDEYDNIWGKQYNYKNGAYGFFAVGGTAYGDGYYYGGRWVFPVDAGVIGVVDMDHSKESRSTLENGKYGCILDISNDLTFEYDKSGIFNFEYDGHSFTINTQEDDEEEEEEYWEEEEDEGWY